MYSSDFHFVLLRADQLLFYVTLFTIIGDVNNERRNYNQRLGLLNFWVFGYVFRIQIAIKELLKENFQMISVLILQLEVFFCSFYSHPLYKDDDAVNAEAFINKASFLVGNSQHEVGPHEP
ncbi:unnamed protein product [Lactuca virosa]|uniref:Uncharacterized protein n=1 Tax=Lactuca virosa TaxID=75947 RepID=A0AAU9PE75_9ASTR|nr:unnamed protein product [Lactuca virosa]